MACCDNPYLADELDPCGCEIEACFNCHEYRYIAFCGKHKPVVD